MPSTTTTTSIASGPPSSNRARARSIHRWLGPFLALPLAFLAVTGLAYKLGEEWFHIPETTGDALMHIHQGAWLGPALKPFDVLLLGLGLLTLAATGLRFAFRRRRAR